MRFIDFHRILYTVEFSNAAENSIRWRSPKDFCCEEGIEYLKEHLKKYM